MWILLRAETRKLLARKMVLLAFALVVLVAWAGPWAGQVAETARELTSERRGARNPYDNGWTALAGSMKLAGGFLSIVLLVIAASSVAEETSQGTLKALCARPIRRSELLLAKLLVTWGFGVVLLLASAGAAALGAEMTLGLYDVPLDPLFPERIKFAFGDMCVLGYQVVALSAWALLGLAGVGLLCSTWLEHSGHATGAAIGALFLCSALAGLSGGAREWVFTTYLDGSFEAFRDIAARISGEETKFAARAARSVYVPLLWAVGLFGLAAWSLERRDIA